MNARRTSSWTSCLAGLQDSEQQTLNLLDPGSECYLLPGKLLNNQIEAQDSEVPTPPLASQVFLQPSQRTAAAAAHNRQACHVVQTRQTEQHSTAIIGQINQSIGNKKSLLAVSADPHRQQMVQQLAHQKIQITKKQSNNSDPSIPLAYSSLNCTGTLLRQDDLQQRVAVHNKTRHQSKFEPYIKTYIHHIQPLPGR